MFITFLLWQPQLNLISTNYKLIFCLTNFRQGDHLIVLLFQTNSLLLFYCFDVSANVHTGSLHITLCEFLNKSLLKTFLSVQWPKQESNKRHDNKSPKCNIITNQLKTLINKKKFWFEKLLKYIFMGYLNVWENNVVAYFKIKENWKKTYLLADVVRSCLYLEAMKKCWIIEKYRNFQTRFVLI